VSDRSKSGARFLLGALLGLAAIGLVGWLTGLRGALHGVVLAAGAVAFLPFISLTLAALIVCAASALAAVTDAGADVFAAGAADGIATGGGKLIRGYYRLLWRLRQHALVSGVGVGVGLAAAVLALVLWFFVVPREAETLAILLEAKARIDASKDPEQLRHPILDAFGRPVEYRRQESWLAASYVLTSRGFDGEESSDDICVAGRSRAGALLAHAKRPLETLRALREGGLGAAQRAQAVRDTRCDRIPEVLRP
jgi:hypothetical protein